MYPARYWKTVNSILAQCCLCPHNCRISEGHAGRCGVRVLRGGALRATGYGMLSGAHTDPIEKKPLYHFYPGATTFSIGGWGCNLSCHFCQNWGISQRIGRSARAVTPAEIVATAMAEPLASAVTTRVIAYTYNEPLINFEFIHDCAWAAHAAKIKNVLVTNGMINPEPAAELLPLIDAINIDIKSMDENFYRQDCGGYLAPVLAFAKQAYEFGCHIEITNLVIPGRNDSNQLFQRLAEWIRDNLSAQTPLHLSAYHPAYKSDIPATSPKLLEQAATLCRQFLAHVFVGNTEIAAGRDTCCRHCGQVQIRRQGWQITLDGCLDGKCGACAAPVDFVS